MDKTIGFIGFGNMGEALAGGILESGLFDSQKILISTRTGKLADKIKYNFPLAKNNKDLAARSDYIVLAIKPKDYASVLKEISGSIKKGAILVSIGAGISSQFLKESLPPASKYVKTMPNTPAMIRQGMTAISPNQSLEEEDLQQLVRIFSSVGRTEIIDESLMDAFTAIAGSSPAYVYMAIEALADGGVMEGLPRQEAYTMAAQALLGSAQMVLESGIHPGQLKDNVCSPGGTTIEAVASLEENGFRSALIKAVEVAAEKSKKMRV